jgi:hypothetical protein
LADNAKAVDGVEKAIQLFLVRASCQAEKKSDQGLSRKLSITGKVRSLAFRHLIRHYPFNPQPVTIFPLRVTLLFVFNRCYSSSGHHPMMEPHRLN